jgi:hypothetical protein
MPLDGGEIFRRALTLCATVCRGGTDCSRSRATDLFVSPV